MHDSTTSRRLRVGSLFSGYGGLDLAVEHHFDARTVWFSEINEPIARLFSHHWPEAPNLGDITAINWSEVPPVDILCGGFPCQDVSTVGKQAGLAPRHPLRTVGKHGHRHRDTATRMGRDRERARVAFCARNPTSDARSTR